MKIPASLIEQLCEMRGAWALNSEQPSVVQLGGDDLIHEEDDFMVEGYALRLYVKQDEHTSVMEDEFYGKFEWARGGGSGTLRPKDFDGNAEKLNVNRGDSLWWQPPDEVKRSDEGFVKFKANVLNLLEYGFSGVVLELLHGEDAYNNPIVVQVASLWGIDSLENGYLKEVVHELVEELEA